MTSRDTNLQSEPRVADPCKAPPLLEPGDALFLDVDGTLLDFADRPHEVTVPAELVETLRKISGRLGGALALVSGRRIEELDALFAPLRLPASGVHGAEFRLDPAKPLQSLAPSAEIPERLADAVSREATAFPGVLVEHKGASVAVHYRRAPEYGPLLKRALEHMLSGEDGHGVELFEAHFAYEVKMRGFDKGKAITAFLHSDPFRRRTPVFVGDDRTDEDGFAVVVERGGRAYSVAGRRQGAVCAFTGPAAVRAWLSDFAG